MASRAAAPLEDENTIRESCAALAGELLNAVREDERSPWRRSDEHMLVNYFREGQPSQM